MIVFTPSQRSAITSVLAMLGTFAASKGWISSEHEKSFANDLMVVGGLLVTASSVIYDLWIAKKIQRRVENVQIATKILKADGIFGEKTEKELLKRIHK